MNQRELRLNDLKECLFHCERLRRKNAELRGKLAALEKANAELRSQLAELAEDDRAIPD